MREHIGVLLPVGHDAVNDIVDLGVIAEALGYRTVAAGEVDTWDATALLSAVAARTTRIGIASSVLAIPSRSIAQIAVAASTLAHLSRGRFTLGIGIGGRVIAGWHDHDSSPGTSDLRTAVDRLKTLLRGERDRESRFRLAHPPPTPVRLLVGALGPRSQEVGLTVADGVIVTTRGSEMVAALRTGVTGELTKEIVAIQWIARSDDVDHARHELARAALPYFTVPGYDRVLDPDERLRLREALRGGATDEAAAMVPEAVIDAVGVSADVTHIEKRVQDLLSAGADEVRLMPLATPTAQFADLLGEIGT